MDVAEVGDAHRRWTPMSLWLWSSAVVVVWLDIRDDVALRPAVLSP